MRLACHTAFPKLYKVKLQQRRSFIQKLTEVSQLKVAMVNHDNVVTAFRKLISRKNSRGLAIQKQL